MILTTVQNLLNSSSKNMAVDGSSASKDFSYSPGSGVASVRALNLLAADDGTSAFNKFLSLSSLSNGVLIEVVIDGVTTSVTNMKDNSDILTRFSPNQNGTLAVSALGALIGLGGVKNIIVGSFSFREPFVLSGSDVIKATVRDNLSSLSSFAIAAVIEQDV